jgi:hypothetical protein
MSEKLCPVCKRKNDVTAAYCIFCGASLEFEQTGQSTTTRRVTSEGIALSEVMEQEYITSLKLPDQGIALYLVDNAKPIAVRIDREFTLGRRLTDIRSETFLDLTPYGGYEFGVSHRHAMIRRTDTGYEILDLESTNGTMLNRKRILPNTPYPLPSGSRIRLGKMVLYTIYNEPSQKK